MAAVSGIAGRTPKPTRWGEGLTTLAHRIFHEFCLEGRRGGEVPIVISEAGDAVEHYGGEPFVWDASAIRSQVSKQDGVIFGDFVHVELTLEREYKVSFAGPRGRPSPCEEVDVCLGGFKGGLGFLDICSYV
jgi:hypothetical protein